MAEAYKGITKKYNISRTLIDKSKPHKKCPVCDGKGVKIQVVRMGPMIQQMQSPCTNCNGKGYLFQTQTVKELLEVPIPPGCPDQHKVRLTEKGDEDDPETIPADVVFAVGVDPHADFVRKGDDLYLRRDISLIEALCGLKMDVTHLDGRKLLISTKPGEIIHPPPAIPTSFEPDYEMFKDCTCEGETVARAEMDQIRDVSQLKKVSLDKGFQAFIIQSDNKVVFKDGDRESLMSTKKNKKGDTLYVITEPKTDMQKAVKNEGMPLQGNPFQHGHLIVQFDIKMPEEINEDIIDQLKKLLPGPINKSKFHEQIEKDAKHNIEEHGFIDIDAKKSLDESKKRQAAQSAYDEDDDGEGPMGGQGMQCAQQ